MSEMFPESDIVPSSNQHVDWPFYVKAPDTESDPVAAFLFAGTAVPSPVVEVEAPAIRFWPFGYRDNNPFVQACRRILSGDNDELVMSALRNEHYFHEFKSAAEVLSGLSGVVNPSLCEFPAWGSVLPWQPWGPSEAVVRNAPGQHGWQHGGPVTDEKLRSEVNRYRHVVESIGLHGYRPDESRVDGHIGAQALVNSGEPAVFLVSDGVHRLSALLAFGVTPIPIALRRRPAVVRRSEVSLWPNVRNGLFQSEEALAVFDSLMLGTQNLDPWRE